MSDAVSMPMPLPSRAARLDELAREPLDTLVIGGGITGAGLALDLAARGLRAALVERDDWAAATSSASSRLIHGGLRYLEQLEFALVRDSCLERGLLLRNAAGIVWPESFVFPVVRGGPTGLLKLAAGLGLYTLVSVPRVLGLPGLHGPGAVARRIPGCRRDGLRGGGTYLDGATDDARLTLAVVRTALRHGAIAVSRLEALALENGGRGAEVRLVDRLGGEERTLQARSVVLAGGPLTDRLRTLAGLGTGWIRPTRGTHILVPRERLPTDGAVIFASPVDRRVMFLLPWPRFTVIGTTDLDADASTPPRATFREVRYLLDSANGLVPAAGLGESDVVSTWAGLRPLLAAPEDAPSARSREERVEREGSIYTIAGGKLTGFRSMAERLGARIAADLAKGDPRHHSPTRSIRLDGALPEKVGRPRWSSLVDGRLGVDPDPVRTAWTRRYVAQAHAVAELCRRTEAGHAALDAETLLGEVDWAVRHEDCLGACDFFLRRTDLAYGTRNLEESVRERVLERLADTLSWSRERLLEERAGLERTLERLHAWRTEDAIAERPSSPCAGGA